MPSVAHIIRRRHSRKGRRIKGARRSAFWSIVIIGIPLALAMTPLLAGLALSLWLYLAAASHMPAPQATVFFEQAQGRTRFLDASGERLIHTVTDPLGEGRRWLALEELPPQLVDATALAEDAGPGSASLPFDLPQTLIQVMRYILGLPLKSQPGISGNLVRDAILPLTAASGLDARLLEIVLVAESKRIHSPEALLEWRLNSAYYGGDAFGIEAAAQVYLGKSALDLSLAESTLLAAIGQAPTLNPVDAAQQARERGADLLFQMLDKGLIEKSQFDEAAAAVPSFRGVDARQSDIAPAFIKYARGQAETLLDRRGLDGARLLARGGLRITTSLDLELQLSAECLLRAHLQQREAAIALDGSPCPPAQSPLTAEADRPDTGALALIDVGSGRILSLAGDALTAGHQPAILLQPFVYLDAFLRREFTPASMVYDVPRSYPGASADLIYRPANADGLYHGPMNLRDAMAAGRLPAAVQVASVSGIEPAIHTAQALGFNSLAASGAGLDLLERGGAVSVLDSAYAYSVLASMGAMRGVPAPPLEAGLRGRDPVAVLKIEDATGQVLWSYEDDSMAKETEIIPPSAAYMVNDILADIDRREAVLQRRESSLPISRAAAVLDGFSADQRDSWTLGYSPDLVLALHTGRLEGARLSPGDGDRAGSAPVWRALMDYAHAHLDLPDRAWAPPADIEEFLVCEISGLLPATTSHCPTRREMVPAGSLMQRDHFWQTVEINRATGHLATVNTPDDLRESVAYFMPPEELMDWWVENGKPLPPSSYSTDSLPPSAKAARITSPADYAYVGSRVDIAASIERAGARTWQLEYGAEVNPDRWIPIGERQTVDASGEISATWNTALFSGIYTLRLSVEFADGELATDSKLLTFDNTPPAVKLRLSEPAAEIRYPSKKTLSLLAEVSDNLTIDRVEFYRDESLLGDDRDWPYGIEAALDGAGDFLFKALAYDKVGNRAASQLSLVIMEG